MPLSELKPRIISLEDPPKIYFRQLSATANDTININTWHRLGAGHLSEIDQEGGITFDGRSDIDVTQSGYYDIFLHFRFSDLNAETGSIQIRLRDETTVGNPILARQIQDYETTSNNRANFSFSFTEILDNSITYRIQVRFESDSGLPLTSSIGDSGSSNVNGFTRVMCILRSTD